MTTDRNIEHLRFLSVFYTNLIETRHIQMNIAEKEFFADKTNERAYEEWTGNKIKICELYENWLKELRKCHVASFDNLAKVMHAMMTSDCYWFLAKMNKRPGSAVRSNYSEACRSLESIFEILHESLHATNPFYQHVLEKYERLVCDYRNAIGEETIRGSSKFVRTGMDESDIRKCRESIKLLKKEKEYSAKDKSNRSEKKFSSSKAFSSHISQLSRIMLNTFV